MTELRGGAVLMLLISPRSYTRPFPVLIVAAGPTGLALTARAMRRAYGGERG